MAIKYDGNSIFTYLIDNVDLCIYYTKRKTAWRMWFQLLKELCCTFQMRISWHFSRFSMIPCAWQCVEFNRSNTFTLLDSVVSNSYDLLSQLRLYFPRLFLTFSHISNVFLQYNFFMGLACNLVSSVSHDFPGIFKKKEELNSKAWDF